MKGLAFLRRLSISSRTAAARKRLSPAAFKRATTTRSARSCPGFETDFNYLGNCRGGTFPAPSAYVPFGIGSYSLSGGCSYYYGSLRARLGYAFDRVLFYGTAGITYGGNRNPNSLNLNPPAPGNYFAAGWSHSARTNMCLAGRA